MRIATIDLGTNTFLLLVADVAFSTVEPLYQEEEIVRLGQDVDRTGVLSEPAMQRGLACLQRYVQKARSYGVEKILACGTSALRQARNREIFIARVQKQLGLTIQVLTGEREAELSFIGALSNKAHLPPPILMVDIGGGSTEICWGNAAAMQGRLSMNVGSVRLTERFLHHDPVLDKEIALTREEIHKHLIRKATAIPSRDTFTLIGVAGTVTTLAAMHQRVEAYDAGRIDGSRLALADIQSLIRQLERKPIEERKKMVGLSPGRADVILAGALILEAVMAYLHQKELIVSDRGLRFGLALEAGRSM